jgi:hypothetical protein
VQSPPPAPGEPQNAAPKGEGEAQDGDTKRADEPSLPVQKRGPLVAFHEDGRRIELAREARVQPSWYPFDQVLWTVIGGQMVIDGQMTLFDAVDWRVIEFRAEGLCASYGRHLLYQGPDGIWFADLATGASRRLARGSCIDPDEQTGRWVLDKHMLFDLEAGCVAGRPGSNARRR